MKVVNRLIWKKGNYMQWPVLFYCAERFVTRESWIYCHCDIFRPIRNVYILSNQENDNNRKEKYILNSLYINRNTHWCIIFVYDYNHHFFCHLLWRWMLVSSNFQSFYSTVYIFFNLLKKKSLILNYKVCEFWYCKRINCEKRI